MDLCIEPTRKWNNDGDEKRFFSVDGVDDWMGNWNGWRSKQ